MSHEDEYEDAFDVPNCPPWIRPERRLLGAIFRQAMVDLTLKEERSRALEWLLQDATEEDEFTLPWICNELGINYQYIQFLLRRIQ